MIILFYFLNIVLANTCAHPYDAPNTPHSPCGHPGKKDKKITMQIFLSISYTNIPFSTKNKTREKLLNYMAIFNSCIFMSCSRAFGHQVYVCVCWVATHTVTFPLNMYVHPGQQILDAFNLDRHIVSG